MTPTLRLSITAVFFDDSEVSVNQQRMSCYVNYSQFDNTFEDNKIVNWIDERIKLLKARFTGILQTTILFK